MTDELKNTYLQSKSLENSFIKIDKFNMPSHVFLSRDKLLSKQQIN